MRTFRLSALSYVVILFLITGTISLITTPQYFGWDGSAWYLLWVLILFPVLVTAYIARTATFINSDGIRVRAIFGSRFLPWDEIRGLSTDQRGVYAVIEDGAVRLPCVKFNELHWVAEASGGHLPDLPAPLLKSPPARRRVTYIRRG